MTNEPASYYTGIAALDNLLGGGLIPGTLTVVAGATGIGKTQLGLHFAEAGARQEGQRGVILDLTARGDSQNQKDYARRLFNWPLVPLAAEAAASARQVWDPRLSRCDYLHLFERAGRRVTRADLDEEGWRAWKIELVKKLQTAIFFLYGNFVQGVRRCVVDGVEPVDRPSESFQFDLFEYLYHQILHKECDWVARDLFREQFRQQQAQVEQHSYDHRRLACLLLYTTREVMLDDLLGRPLETGDALSNANTIIVMGKVREGSRMGRALQVAKHRGSDCDESIVPFQITPNGLQLAPEPAC